MQVIEGVEEALVGLFLATEELNVIDQQHLYSAIATPKILGGPVADSGYELVGELL